VSRSLAKILPIKPPKELVPFLDDPPLVGDETTEDYFRLFTAIVIAAKPTDAIDWLYVKSVVDLTWEHRRELAIKARIIKLMQKEIVLDLLKTTHEAPTSLESNVYRIFNATDEANRWTVDPTARTEIDAKLAAKGYPASEVLARAYIKGASQIDAVDRRIASYEDRRMVALREIERRNEKLARQLEKASSEIIDAEFSEAAE
jgi:hypothetical protein